MAVAQFIHDGDSIDYTPTSANVAAGDVVVQGDLVGIAKRDIPAGRISPKAASVFVFVNGAVFDAQVVKPSGNRVYDEAVERAINGIQNWPLPQNAELFGGRRELILRIEHER